MSIEKNQKEKSFESNKCFLGIKTESLNSRNKSEDPDSFSKICKICGISKTELFKCSKCSFHFCNECIKQTNETNLNKLKNIEYICSNCQNIEKQNKRNKESFSIECYICRNKHNEKNIVCYNVDQDQKTDFQKYFFNNEISLCEEEDLINQNDIKWAIKLCNKCIKENKEIIGNIFTKNTKKENKNNNNVEIKDKREANIFNILDSNSENSVNYSKDEIKPKEINLFDRLIMEKQKEEK